MTEAAGSAAGTSLPPGDSIQSPRGACMQHGLTQDGMLNNPSPANVAMHSPPASPAPAASSGEAPKATKGGRGRKGVATASTDTSGPSDATAVTSAKAAPMVKANKRPRGAADAPQGKSQSPAYNAGVLKKPKKEKLAAATTPAQTASDTVVAQASSRPPQRQQQQQQSQQRQANHVSDGAGGSFPLPPPPPRSQHGGRGQGFRGGRGGGHDGNASAGDNEMHVDITASQIQEIQDRERDKGKALLELRCLELNTKKCVLPELGTMFQEAPWQYEGNDFKEELALLNDTKGKLDTLDRRDWEKLVDLVNPASKVREKLRAIGAQMPTIAWAKMYEMLAYPGNLLLPLEDELRSTSFGKPGALTVHLCEAPGAFVCATNHYMRTHRAGWNWDWVAMSLNPFAEGNDQNAMIDDDRLIVETKDHWCFGEDATGDIRRTHNIRRLWADAEERGLAIRADDGLAIMVTADGAVDTAMDPNKQEQITASLHYCEMVAALGVLAKGGSFVWKAFTTFEHPAICSLYLMGCFFERVHIYKPATSKSTNSETYVVGTTFRGITEEQLEFLLAQCGDDIFTDKAMFPLESMPTEFLRSVRVATVRFAQCTIEAINDALERNGHVPRPHLTALRNNQQQFADHWMQRFQVLPIPYRQPTPQELQAGAPSALVPWHLAPFAQLDGRNNNTGSVAGKRRRDLQGTLVERQKQYAQRNAALGLESYATAETGGAAAASASSAGGTVRSDAGGGGVGDDNPDEPAAKRLQPSFKPNAAVEKMLADMGYKAGTGLGREGQGIVDAIEANGLGLKKTGLGFGQEAGAREEKASYAPQPDIAMLTNTSPLTMEELAKWPLPPTVMPPEKLIKSKLVPDDDTLTALRTARNGMRAAAAAGASGIAAARCRCGRSVCAHVGVCAAPRKDGHESRAFWKLWALDHALGFVESAALAAKGIAKRGQVSRPIALDLSLHGCGSAEFLVGGFGSGSNWTATVLATAHGSRFHATHAVNGVSAWAPNSALGSAAVVAGHNVKVEGGASDAAAVDKAASMDTPALSDSRASVLQHLTAASAEQLAGSLSGRATLVVGDLSQHELRSASSYTTPGMQQQLTGVKLEVAADDTSVTAAAASPGQQAKHQDSALKPDLDMDEDDDDGFQGGGLGLGAHGLGHGGVAGLGLGAASDGSSIDSKANEKRFFGFVSAGVGLGGVKLEQSPTEAPIGSSATAKAVASPTSTGLASAPLATADTTAALQYSYGPLEVEFDRAYRRQLLWECLVALLTLQPGGTFVLRLADCLTLSSASLLYILHRCFASICVLKPFASCVCSSERFVVCSGRLDDAGAGARYLAHVLTRAQEVEGSDPSDDADGRGPANSPVAVKAENGLSPEGGFCAHHKPAQVLSDLVPASLYIGKPFGDYLTVRTQALAKEEVKQLRHALSKRASEVADATAKGGGAGVLGEVDAARRAQREKVLQQALAELTGYAEAGGLVRAKTEPGNFSTASGAHPSSPQHHSAHQLQHSGPHAAQHEMLHAPASHAPLSAHARPSGPGSHPHQSPYAALARGPGGVTIPPNPTNPYAVLQKGGAAPVCGGASAAGPASPYAALHKGTPAAGGSGPPSVHVTRMPQVYAGSHHQPPHAHPLPPPQQHGHAQPQSYPAQLQPHPVHAAHPPNVHAPHAAQAHHHQQQQQPAASSGEHTLEFNTTSPKGVERICTVVVHAWPSNVPRVAKLTVQSFIARPPTSPTPRPPIMLYPESEEDAAALSKFMRYLARAGEPVASPPKPQRMGLISGTKPTYITVTSKEALDASPEIGICWWL